MRLGGVLAFVGRWEAVGGWREGCFGANGPKGVPPWVVVFFDLLRHDAVMPKLQSSPSSGEGLKDGGQANPADATEDLFSPGAGQPPPHLAGRGLELQSLADVLRKRLQKGLPPKNAVLLHGARGTGKTCLMRQALADLPSNIKQVHLDADDFLHAETMANAIINQAMRGRSIAKRTLNFSVGATVGGTGGHITIGRGEGAPPAPSAASWTP